MIRTFLFKKLLNSFISHGPKKLLRYVFIVIFLVLTIFALLFIGFLSLAFFLFGELFQVLGTLAASIESVDFSTLWQKLFSLLQ